MRIASLLACLGVVSAVLAPRPLSADKPAPPPAPPVVPEAPAPEAPAPAPPVAGSEIEPQVGKIRGEGVNLRVGPRVDHEPVAQLERGAIVIVVEKIPGWYGVRVPAGFPAAVSAEFVVEESPDEVRVKAKRLNVRVQPPEEGRPPPGCFRDPFLADQVLTRISSDRGWVWVLAPEELRAYVSVDYVELLGPLAEHADQVVAARDARAKEVQRLKDARAAAATAQASLALRSAIGQAQQKLYRLRLEAGPDKTPVALVHEELTQAVAAAPHAPPPDKVLASLMLEDLDREMDLREARAEAAQAALRGQPMPPMPSIAPQESVVEIEGELKWEAVPGWREGGVYVLWQDQRPKRVLRLGTGGPLPHPDLRARCDGKIWRFRGASPGERTLGLPVVDVKEVLAPTSLPR